MLKRLIFLQLFTFLSSNLYAAAGMQCNQLFHFKMNSIETSARENLISWHQLQTTDPKKYQEGQPFTFLVSRPSFNVIRPGVESVDFATYFSSEGISSRPITSLSLITKEKSNTYHGDVAMILKVPAENIVATSPVDMMSNPIRRAYQKSAAAGNEATLFYQNKFPILAATELIRATSAKTYNEILAVGTSQTTGRKIEVVGFVVQRVDGELKLANHHLEKLKALSQKMGLPLLIIDSKQTDFDEIRKRQLEYWPEAG